MSWMHWRMKKTRSSFNNIGESSQLPNAPGLTSNSTAKNASPNYPPSNKQVSSTKSIPSRKSIMLAK